MKLALLLAAALISPLAAGCATEEEALPAVDSSAFAAGTWDRQSGGTTFERLELFADRTFAYTYVYPDDYVALYGTWNGYARELILSEIVDRDGFAQTSQRFSYYADDRVLVRGAYHYDDRQQLWNGWDTLATARADLIIVEPSFIAEWVPMYSDGVEVFAGGAYPSATGGLSLNQIPFDFYADQRVLGRRDDSRSVAGLVSHPLDLAVTYDRVN